MKRTLVLGFLLALSAFASSGAGSSVSGSSGRFVVDTRPDVLIEDVYSDYCSGAYAGQGGTRATFISGVRCDIRFTIRASGRDGNRIEHYYVNNVEQDGNTFTYNVGDLLDGERLTVVAADGSGNVSDPFRVNIEIAPPPPMWDSAWVHTVVADMLPREGRVEYHGPECKVFDLFEAFDTMAGIGCDEDVGLQLSPSLKLWQTVSSDTGRYCEGSDWGGKAKNSLGHFGKLELTAALTGGMVYQYFPNRESWLPVSGEMGVNYEGSWKIRQPLPQCPLIYAELGLLSKGSFVLRENGGRWRGDLSLDPLVALRASVGAGIDSVAEAEISGQGGLHLEANVPDGLERIFLRGKFTWRVMIIGFEQEGIWWQQDAQLYPRAQDPTWANALFASGLRNAPLPSPGMDGGFRPIPRNYGNGSIPGLRRSTALRGLLAASDPGETQILMHDGYPTPQPALAAFGSKAALAYIRDTEGRGKLDRTEIVFREEDGSGSWGDETQVWDDGTADFQPKLALLSDGTAIAAWANAKRTFADDTPLESVCAALEIAVGVHNSQSGAWTCANLTDDAALDWLPVLKGAANGTAAVAWVRNASGSYVGSSAQPSDIAVSFYRDGAWTAKDIAVGGVGAVLSHDLAWDGDRAVLVWAADADGNLSTDDSEIWAKSFDRGSWSDAMRLSSPSAGAQRPFVWFRNGGTPHVIWVKDGVLFAADGLDGAGVTNVAMTDGTFVPGDYRVAVRENGSATLLWTTAPADSKDGLEGKIIAADYTPNATLAAPSVFLSRQATLRNLSGAVDDIGTFRVAYEVVTTNVERRVVDLAVSRREAVRDVGVMTENCSFATAPVIGEANVLRIGVQNFGSDAVGPFDYRVWAGANEEKTLLGSGQLSVPPLSCEVVEVPWTPTEGLSDVAFTVELDPENEIADSNPGNNALVWRPDVGRPQLSFSTAKAVKATDTLRLISARIHNDAVAPVPAGTVVKFWRGEIGGELIGTDTAGVVSGGAAGEYDVGVAWDISGVRFSSAWEQIVIELPPEAGGDRITVWTDTPLYDPGADPREPVKEGVDTVVEAIGETGSPAYVMTLANGGVPFIVGSSWFSGFGIDISGGVTPTLMNGLGRNGLPRYQSFLFGLSPESEVPAEEQLKAMIAFDADGLPVISCSPRRESSLVTYTTLGKPSLGAVEWVEVTPVNKASMKFFKVKAELAK